MFRFKRPVYTNPFGSNLHWKNIFFEEFRATSRWLYANKEHDE